ncbi:MAG: gliding motility protein GldM [Prolixibacteraceae bacterium]|nr:gliding motility protein GldM [Prolixibacteraceae bacterium]
MGTKNCPETPRQKMINMMYLVLTAMLALNVAAETLQAFKIVDSSLMKTYLSFSDKNETLITNFKSAYEINPGKVEKWMEMAYQVHAKSDSIVRYLIDTKEMLALMAKAQPKKPDEELTDEFPFIVTNNRDTLILESQDDLNASPVVMLTQERGAELQTLLNQFKQELIAMVDDSSVINNLNSAIDVDDPDRNLLPGSGQSMNFRTWSQQNFEATPVIAAVTLISKLQIDVRNAESAVLRHLYNQIDAASFKFTGLKATVIPEASYIFQGQPYKARIFLSAEDSTQKLEVFVNGSTLPLKTEGNEAIYTFTPNEIGVFKYRGQIKYRNPDGDGYSYKDFEQEYQVARPAVTISPTKMNVLYKDLKNPIDIAVPGIPSDKLRPVVTNGTIYKEGDLWIIEPSDLDNLGERTKVIVNAELNGSQRPMGEMVFRVKRVPDPKATVAKMSSGAIPREQLRLQQIVSATLEDFDFDLSFEVTKFDMSVPTSGGLTTTLHSNSFRFTDEQKRLLNGLGAGDKVSFENIFAKIAGDKNDVERKLSPIILTVQ